MCRGRHVVSIAGTRAGRGFRGTPEGRGFALRALGTFLAAALALRAHRLASHFSFSEASESRRKQAKAGGSKRKQAEASGRRPKQEKQAEANPNRARGPDTRAYVSLFLDSLSFLERSWNPGAANYARLRH